MSAISTAPAPSFEAPRTSGRKVLVAGAVVVGLVAAGAVAIPRLTTQTATASYTAVTQHDAMEHQLDVTRARSATAAQKALPEGYTRQYVGGQLQVVPLPRIVGRSVVAQQTGAQGHYAYVPTHKVTRYDGSRLITEWVPVAERPSSLQQEQTGGHATFPFTGTTRHMTWTDPWVPPYDNPEWVPYIKSHYFSPVATAASPTHEFH